MDANIGTFYLETGKTNDFSSTYRTTFPPVWIANSLLDQQSSLFQGWWSGLAMTSRSTPVSIEYVYLLVTQGLSCRLSQSGLSNHVLTYCTPPPMFLAYARCSESGAQVNNRAFEKMSRNWGEQRPSPQSVSSNLFHFFLATVHRVEKVYNFVEFASRVECVRVVDCTARQKHESALYLTIIRRKWS